jgi:hypothetical protein
MQLLSSIRVLAALVALCATSVAVAGPAQAGPADTPASSAYQDYLTGSGAGLAIGASGSGQCGKAKALRIGRWICPAPKPAGTDAETAAAALRASARTAAADDPTIWCNEWGCRYRYDDFAADLDVGGIYGWGDTQLGQMSGYVFFQLSGALTRSDPIQYLNTRDTTNVVFTADLLNSAPGAEGTQVPGQLRMYQAGNAEGGIIRDWPNGYSSYDNTMWNHSQIQQWSFSVDGYPGYWYIFAKSTCTWTEDKQIYRYFDVGQVPANANGGGWRS